MIIDYLDISDPNLETYEVANIQAAGGTPVTLNMSRANSISLVIDAIIGRAGSSGVITLLRIHGHGAAGLMGVADSANGNVAWFFNAFTVSNIICEPNEFYRLRPYFAAGARVELHGCNVGSGKRGMKLLLWLARIWSVQVSAGIGTQYGSTTFNFDGPYRTAYPNGSMRRRQN